MGDHLERVRIVPLGEVTPETVAEFAHRARRRIGSAVEVIAPRSIRSTEASEMIARAAAPDFHGDRAEVTLGIGITDGEDARIATDPSRGVSVVVLPARRAAEAIMRGIDAALASLAPPDAA